MLFLWEDFERVTNNRALEPWKALYAKMQERCERYIAEPFPETDRTLHNWTLERARVLLEVTTSLGVCYKLTGDSRFARRAVEFLMDSLDWELWFYRTGVANGGPYDLGTAETAMAFAVALPMVSGMMSNAEHQRCMEVLDRRTLTPFLENTVPGDIRLWWHHGLNNWNCVCNGGQLAISLYMRSRGFETTRVELAISRALSGLQVYFDAMHSDGSCEEGVGYWGYATKYFVMALLYWENATGQKHPFFAEEKCKKWLRFPFELSEGNAPLGFGDVSGVFSSEMAYAYAARIGDGASLAETAARMGEKGGVLALMFTRGAGEGLPEQKRGFTWYPDNGWAVFRKDGFTLSFRSGSTNVSHAQKDMNSIQLARGGESLLRNMGNHPYPVGWFSSARDLYWENSTASKSAALFNGIGQIRAGDADYNCEGERVVSECAATYPDFIALVRRTAGFAESAVFGVEDELEAKQEMWHELRFISPGSFERVSQDLVRVSSGGQSATLRFACDKAFDIWVGETFFSIPGKPGIGVLRVYTKDAVLRSKWTTLIG